MNYLGECFVIRTALAEKLGGLRRDFAPSQIYDLALRAVERTDTNRSYSRSSLSSPTPSARRLIHSTLSPETRSAKPSRDR